jgi:hypothetical protein
MTRLSKIFKIFLIFQQRFLESINICHEFERTVNNTELPMYNILHTLPPAFQMYMS